MKFAITVAAICACGIGALAGCETIEAIGSGEMIGKSKRSNYAYGLPDRYRAGIPTGSSSSSSSTPGAEASQE